MKKLMITGCNGQLGRAINKVYEGNGEFECLNTDVPELDITDLEAVRAYVSLHKPYAIINCAAYTAVDKCETDEDNAYRINAIGPKNLAIAAGEMGIKLIHVSTDYVFRGDACKPYIESDTPDPVSAYGRTKLAGEQFVQEYAGNWFILRTAWLYGDGKNFVRTMLRLAETHEEVGVVYDQVGNPTSAAELARAIAYLVPTEQYGIYHATCEGVCSWADFAAEIFRQCGLKTKVNRLTSEEYPSPTKRPAYSVLEKKHFNESTEFRFADWQDALTEYLKTEGVYAL